MVVRQIATLTELLKTEPTAENFYARGYGYYNTGDLNKAAADYERAIAMEPDNFDYHYSMGMLRDKTGEFQKAIDAYTRCIALDDSRSKAFFNRAFSKSQQKDLTGSVADYTQAIALHPKNYVAYFNRGVVYRNQGKHELAVSDFNATLNLNPSFTDARQNRGISLAALNNPDALADFNKSVQELPQDPESYYNRALYFINYSVKGDYCADLRKAAQLGLKAAGKLAQEKGCK